MRKFLAVIKREYVQRVRSRMFVFLTVLAPLVLSLFGLAPAIVMNIRAGGPLRIAVIDQTGKLYMSFRDSVMDEAQEADVFGNSGDADEPDANANMGLRPGSTQRAASVALEAIYADGRSLNEIKAELTERVRVKDLDAYLILPANLLAGGKPEFFGSNAGDVFTKKFLQKALSRAVREQRLIDAHIDVQSVQNLSRPIKIETRKIGAPGDDRDSEGTFALVFGVGFVMYLTILMYGQVILGAVIEEKETRIAEILFSSVKPFTLMMGKLVGVSLVALTQLAIWGLAFSAFALYGVKLLAARGMRMHIPGIPLIHFVYFALFFLLGYFIYSTIYALIGSMVTTAQEGGQLSMPVVLLPLIGFYMFLPVTRSPDSSFAFWVSMIPFFAPMTMLVRIVTQTPPLWQIVLSLLLGFGSVALLTWIAGRIYRVGMLMSGKKATIPEVWRWVRRA